MSLLLLRRRYARLVENYTWTWARVISAGPPYNAGGRWARDRDTSTSSEFEQTIAVNTTVSSKPIVALRRSWSGDGKVPAPSSIDGRYAVYVDCNAAACDAWHGPFVYKQTTTNWWEFEHDGAVAGIDQGIERVSLRKA